MSKKALCVSARELWCSQPVSVYRPLLQPWSKLLGKSVSPALSLRWQSDQEEDAELKAQVEN